MLRGFSWALRVLRSGTFFAVVLLFLKLELSQLLVSCCSCRHKAHSRHSLSWSHLASLFCDRLRAPKRGWAKEECSAQHRFPTHRVLGKTYHFRRPPWFAREIYPHVSEEFLPVELMDIPNDSPIFPGVINRRLPALFELLCDEKDWPEDKKDNLESDF